MKPNKSDVNLEQLKTLSSLPCQALIPFSSDKTLSLPETFSVETEVYESTKKNQDNQMKKLLASCLRGNTESTEIILPSWAGTQVLLSESQVPLMHVDFLPFLPHPVTEHATVYTAMLNYVKVLNQLEQKSLLIFCDEGVFRLVLNIYT